MHGRLLDIIKELLSCQVQPPEGIKSKCMDPAKTITAYAGSPKFGDLEDWLMSVCVYLAIAQYGGDGRDRERVLIIMDFLS
ncbi:hypothetical protein H0H92_000261, partial [Tricholoma furcatifolium]